MCNAGVQACMLAYAIHSVFPNSPIQVYNGSMGEMKVRNPKRISAVMENV
ncbi:unnamed protein product [Cylicostephanus goldi]|uniref:Uncharacterized protein n=1 Tax=Cylicostephanus goldi TaxID=71465 RepID=A0A3P7QDA9_CYLGO|nr:unnamed protein product [Cylicostephanus goldi]